jgi:hypothetical protein
MKLGCTNFVMWIKRQCINEEKNTVEWLGVEHRDTFPESNAWLADYGILHYEYNANIPMGKN